MDISARSSSYLTNTGAMAQIQRQQEKESSFQAALDKAVQEKDDRELRKSCQEFESYFIGMMMKQMRQSVNFVNSEGMFSKGMAENIFQEMLDEEYAQSSTQAGGIGLADMMFAQMKREMVTAGLNNATVAGKTKVE